MNSFARNDDNGEYILAEEIDLSSHTLPYIALGRDTIRGTQHASGLPLRWKDGAPVGFVPTALHQRRLIAKRIFDFVAALLGLIALAPLLAIVALAIAVTSPGPVLFRQEREGIDGKLFKVFKFRSMRVDECDASGVAQTMKDDPRVTPVGRFLRRTSIDELPQLLNVVTGDMSLVGPRPHVVGMRAGGMPYKTLVPDYDLRLAVRPGITGWAQVNGLRGMTVDPVSARQRIDHDIAYVQHFSLWLDLRIIAKTIVTEFVTGTSV